MPFIKNLEIEEFDFPEDDPDFDAKYEQIINELPFEYEQPWENCQLNPTTFPPDLQAFYEGLRKSGLTHFVVTYDGGCDEGFSSPDSFRRGSQVLTLEEAIKEFKATAKEQLNTIEDSGKQESQTSKPSFFQKLFGAKQGPAPSSSLPPQRVPPIVRRDNHRDFVDALAEHVAVSVMGQGYGTGDYELYGRAVLDLASGRVSDDNQAPKPKNATGFESDEDGE